MLSTILQYASEVTGIKPTDDDRRAHLLRLINRASSEMHDSHDLPGVLMEQNFLAPLQTDGLVQFTCPWYVDQIRAARVNDFYGKVEMVDLRPRYHYQPWRQPWLQWRIRNRTPLTRDMTQACQLVFTLGAAETDTIIVTVVGETTLASRAVENVTIEPGDTSVTTTNQWKVNGPLGIVSIQKNKITNTDITITQAVDGLTVGTIANRASRAENILVQVSEIDTPYGPGENTCIELLYKRRFIEMYYDEDEFYDDKLENAIIWKLRENWYTMQQGKEELAVAANAKFTDLIQRVCQNQESEVSKRVNFAPNRFENAILNTSMEPIWRR